MGIIPVTSMPHCSQNTAPCFFQKDIRRAVRSAGGHGAGDVEGESPARLAGVRTGAGPPLWCPAGAPSRARRRSQRPLGAGRQRRPAPGALRARPPPPGGAAAWWSRSPGVMASNAVVEGVSGAVGGIVALVATYPLMTASARCQRPWLRVLAGGEWCLAQYSPSSKPKTCTAATSRSWMLFLIALPSLASNVLCPPGQITTLQATRSDRKHESKALTKPPVRGHTGTLGDIADVCLWTAQGP